jgi:riboflavin biosynthesis pyrimidine reductase
MRRLLPRPAADVDPYEAYADVPARWLRVGMVMSADGSATDEERWTDRLGGAADFRVFRTLRALCDGIIVGAATVRTGRLGPHRLSAELRARRGRGPAPMVVVSRSLRLDWTLPIFSSARARTVVVTCAEGMRAAGGAAPGREAGVDTVVAGDSEVDLAAALAELRDRLGLCHLLCEGGPTLAAGLIAAGLVDELCLSVAPTLLGTRGHTPLLGALPARREMELRAAYADDGVVFLRYRPADH